VSKLSRQVQQKGFKGGVVFCLSSVMSMWTLVTLYSYYFVHGKYCVMYLFKEKTAQRRLHMDLATGYSCTISSIAVTKRINSEARLPDQI
jgi:purine-cytosine permease-like protein